MALILSLVAAASWGAADFLGGLSGRRGDARAWLPVTASTQAVGFALMIVAALVVGWDSVTTSDLAWGAAGGLSGGVGVGMLYRGLATGRMSVVAPITAAESAAIPVAFGALRGEIPSPVASLGAALAFIAILIVSSAPEPGTEGSATSGPDDAGNAPRSSGVGSAIVSGIGFAGVFIALEFTGEGSGLVPLLPMKLVATLLMTTVAVAVGRGLRSPAGTGALRLGTGTLDTVAITAFLLATRQGLIALVAVVGSLYPAGTILLARFVLHERLQRVQIVGLLVAALAVTLIAVG